MFYLHLIIKQKKGQVMKKKILAVIGIMTITAAMLAGCSSKDVEADAEASTEPTSQTVSVSDTTKATESTTVAESTTDEATSTTKKKDGSITTKKAASKTTAKVAPKTTAKQTTKSTTAAATTQATTKATTKTTTKATVKNVSAKDVQAQVNAYIRSKGITVDSSLNSGNSGWSGAIAGEQVDRNNGYSLRTCKSYVDSEIAELGTNVTMNCYFDGTFFYICYM